MRKPRGNERSWSVPSEGKKVSKGVHFWPDEDNQIQVWTAGGADVCELCAAKVRNPTLHCTAPQTGHEVLCLEQARLDVLAVQVVWKRYIGKRICGRQPCLKKWKTKCVQIEEVTTLLSLWKIEAGKQDLLQTSMFQKRHTQKHSNKRSQERIFVVSETVLHILNHRICAQA